MVRWSAVQSKHNLTNAWFGARVEVVSKAGNTVVDVVVEDDVSKPPREGIPGGLSELDMLIVILEEKTFRHGLSSVISSFFHFHTESRLFCVFFFYF